MIKIRPALVVVLSTCIGLSTLASAAAATGRSATSKEPVLGSTKVFGTYGTGWGTVKPKNLDDDTDCTGSISGIRWQMGGGETAHGTGFTCTDDPQTGGTRVQIRLLPTDLGRCQGSKRLTYRHFVVQFPTPSGGWNPKQNWLGLRNFCKPENQQA